MSNHRQYLRRVNAKGPEQSSTATSSAKVTATGSANNSDDLANGSDDSADGGDDSADGGNDSANGVSGSIDDINNDSSHGEHSTDGSVSDIDS